MDRRVEGGLAIAAVVAGAVLGGAIGLAAAFVAATAARMLARRGWFEADDARGAAVLGGAIVGVVALAAAVACSDAIAAAVGRGVEWSTVPVVRGSLVRAATVALVVAAVGFAAELTLRRWLLEQVAVWLVAAGVSRGEAIAGGVVAAAVAEAAIAPLGGARLGVAVTSVGLGLLYVGAGRRLGASLAARTTFELGAVALQALRLVA